MSTTSASVSSSGASGASAIPSGLRRRVAGSSSGASRSSAVRTTSGRGMSASSAGILRFYTDDAPGLKVGPTTVLVSALMFVGFVVLLHVWGKFRS